jgi:hypothetical protein
MGASASVSVISCSILLPIFMICSQVLYTMIGDKHLIYHLVLASTMIGMSIFSWGITRDLAIGEDTDRIGTTLLGWFVFVSMILAINYKWQIINNITDIFPFQISIDKETN